MADDDYIDRVALKLKRQYSKDEYVAHLLKQVSDLEIEKGVLQSERDEAVDKYNDIMKLDQKAKSALGQEKKYQKMKAEVEKVRQEKNKLKKEKEELLIKLAKHNLINK